MDLRPISGTLGERQEYSLHTLHHRPSYTHIHSLIHTQGQFRVGNSSSSGRKALQNLEETNVGMEETSKEHVKLHTDSIPRLGTWDAEAGRRQLYPT